MRKELERALGQRLGQALFEDGLDDEEIGAILDVIFDALAESKDVIVIECEVEHDNDKYCPLTSIEYRDPETRDSQVLDIRGTHGTPGKYLFIGLPDRASNSLCRTNGASRGICE